MTLMHLPLALTLALAPGAPAPLAQETIHVIEVDATSNGVGLTLYVPKHLDSRELIGYALEMVDRSFFTETPNGGSVKLDRFLQVRHAVGIQGNAEDRALVHKLLTQLDGAVGALESPAGAPPEAPKPERRAIRLRTISPNAAQALVSGAGLPVNVHVVQETGTVVLSGDLGNVNVAQHMIASADEPLPQMTLVCEVIEAVDPAAVGDRAPVEGELAHALAAVVPGKVLVRRGRAMVRGSVGGQRMVSLSTELPRVSDTRRAPRLELQAMPAGWDGERGVLQLQGCEIVLEEPLPAPSGSAGPTTPIQAGMDRSVQRLSTTLALHAGETTVVGSLGGEPLFVAMTVTVR